MEFRNDVTGENDTFVFGRTYVRMSANEEFQFATEFCQLKRDLWLVGPPQEVLARCGVTCTDSKRAQDLSNMFDGDISGFYYVAAASPPGSEEAIKWVLGALAATLNERSLPFSKINDVLPADYLRAFCDQLESRKIDRTFSREIFAELIDAERFGREDDPDFDHAIDEDGRSIRRLAGTEVLDAIVANPRFKASGAEEIDVMIDAVIEANPDQVRKAIADPRVVQWFVGQVMKQSKGKASAPVVQEKLRARLVAPVAAEESAHPGP